ncbi:MAG: hypothetical protein RLZZ577_68 [Bacteroidota bacterium]
MPKIKEESFKKAICNSGFYGYKSKWLGSTCYKLIPLGCGMANVRLQSMKFTVKFLKEKGWDVSYFYQMD